MKMWLRFQKSSQKASAVLRSRADEATASRADASSFSFSHTATEESCPIRSGMHTSTALTGPAVLTVATFVGMPLNSPSLMPAATRSGPSNT